jgi:integrase
MARYAKVAGIYPVSWKNGDGSRVLKFRVKKSRKGIKLDKLFDSMDEAKRGIEEFFSPANQDRYLAELEAKKMDMFAPTLDGLFKRYLEEISIKKSPRTRELETMYFTKTFPETRILESSAFGWQYYAVNRASAEQNNELVPFGKLPQHRVTTEHIEQYIYARRFAKVAHSTIRRELSTLGAFFAKLPEISHMRRDVMPPNPFLGLAKKNLLDPPPKMRNRRLTADEEDRLVSALATRRAPRIPLVLSFALITGLRQSEMLSIRWQQIDLEKRTICIPPSHTKNQEAHYVAITPEVEENILAFRTINPPNDGSSLLIGYTSDGLKSAWDRLVKRAQIADFKWHDLRHEFISRLAEAGHGLYEVKALSRSKHIKEAPI